MANIRPENTQSQDSIAQTGPGLPGEARGLACELRQGKLALLEDHHVLHYLALFPQPGAADSVLHE